MWGSGPGSAHVISLYVGTYNVRQRLRRACASVHFQYSIDGSGMSSITAFMLNGSLILCLTTQTTTWKKALLYISLYRQTYIVNLLSCLTLCFAWLFFKVTTSTVTCKCPILTTRQRMTSDLYILVTGMTLVLHLRCAFSRGNCNS